MFAGDLSGAVPRRQILKNKNSKYQRYKRVELKTMAASRAMADEFGKAHFATTQVTDAIDSLDVAVSAGTTTYAGITRATSGDGLTWAAQVDSTTATFSPSALNAMYLKASESDEHPNLIVSNNKGFRLYYDYLTPLQREGTDTLVGKMGFQSALFNGVPFVIDSHVPSADRSVPSSPYGSAASAEYIYGLNMNHIDLVIHEDAVFEFEEVVAPYDRLVHIGRYYSMLNVANYAPRLCFKMTAIAN
jgi:hypothetical protein